MEDKLNQMKKKGNDLSDIVLEEDVEKTEKLKKFLLGAASIILLILIILIIAKMINKDNVTPKESISSVGESIENSVDVGSNAISDAGLAAGAAVGATGAAIGSGIDNLAENVGDAVQKVDDSLKKNPIIDEASETDLKFEEMVRKLKEQDEQSSKPSTMASSSSSESEPVVQTLSKSQAGTKVIEESMPKEVTKRVTQPVSSPAVTKKSSSPIIISDSEPSKYITSSSNSYSDSYKTAYVAPTKSKSISSIKPVGDVFDDLKNKSFSTSTMSGYFIQVGATANAFPSKKFLNRVKNAGFDYIVHSVRVKGRNIKKILVGPYSTRNEAANEIGSVRARVNPDAYIYRVK